jgi:hypothetical protein
MTEIKQTPMMEPLAEQKKKRPLCEICNKDRSYQSWDDALISFANPAEHYHLDCLQRGVRELRQRIKKLEDRLIILLQEKQNMSLPAATPEVETSAKCERCNVSYIKKEFLTDGMPEHVCVDAPPPFGVGNDARCTKGPYCSQSEGHEGACDDIPF